MSYDNPRFNAIETAFNRRTYKRDFPQHAGGRPLRISEYYAENVFDIRKAKSIPGKAKQEVLEVIAQGKHLSPELAEIMSTAITEWVMSKGVTHFCHWFQPLTGGTAEKHDSLLELTNDNPIEKLTVSQLLQGEPDASSFPNGGSRSTFEARGYTSWDLTSPIFILENDNGKTLCLPTVFVSYHGQALDIKTPLVRSCNRLNELVTQFLQLTALEGEAPVSSVDVTCGVEQEYFLVDKAFYALRPDLFMTGRTLMGSLAAKNQQLEDHYFGMIEERVLNFMQDLEFELYKVGIPAKTRHNEVAPGQYELAPIFSNANVASDQNQLTMALMKKIAKRHNFVALLHEKPFAGVNGNGKHINWSLADNNGKNLLKPGKNPHENSRFLALVSIVMQALHRHAETIRASIASHGNDHRLGANEAPPSILSMFLGETLTAIFEKLAAGESYKPSGETFLDMGAKGLAQLLKDNTDRNRTSPFAFTGDKFEFRAVGGSAAIGFPVAILNAAVADVFKEANTFLVEQKQQGQNRNEALMALAKKFYQQAAPVVFNGDGYSDQWTQEAAKRKLPNLKNTAEALAVFANKEKTQYLAELEIFTTEEIETRYNVLLDRYTTHRAIEFETLAELVDQQVIPAALKYKSELLEMMTQQAQLGISSQVEKQIYHKLDEVLEELFKLHSHFTESFSQAQALQETGYAEVIARDLFPASEKISKVCNRLEDIIPNHYWTLPKYDDMLYIR